MMQEVQNEGNAVAFHTGRLFAHIQGGEMILSVGQSPENLVGREA